MSALLLSRDSHAVYRREWNIAGVERSFHCGKLVPPGWKNRSSAIPWRGFSSEHLKDAAKRRPARGIGNALAITKTNSSFPQVFRG